MDFWTYLFHILFRKFAIKKSSDGFKSSDSPARIRTWVAGSKALVNYLRGFARSRFFSCALAPPVVAGLRKALELCEKEPELRDRLWENVEFMQSRLRDAGVDVSDHAQWAAWLNDGNPVSFA